MSSQSLITPAMFIVSALVLPINKNTACTRGRKCRAGLTTQQHNCASVREVGS
jgi:hypothetical protein